MELLFWMCLMVFFLAGIIFGMVLISIRLHLYGHAPCGWTELWLTLTTPLSLTP